MCFCDVILRLLDLHIHKIFCWAIFFILYNIDLHLATFNSIRTLPLSISYFILYNSRPIMNKVTVVTKYYSISCMTPIWFLLPILLLKNKKVCAYLVKQGKRFLAILVIENVIGCWVKLICLSVI